VAAGLDESSARLMPNSLFHFPFGLLLPGAFITWVSRDGECPLGASPVEVVSSARFWTQDRLSYAGENQVTIYTDPLILVLGAA